MGGTELVPRSLDASTTTEFDITDVNPPPLKMTWIGVPAGKE
jgi:hypothetical protein